MNYELVSAVRGSSAAVTPRGRHLHLVMATYADKHGIAWPSKATVGRETGLSRSSVYAGFAELKERGCIVEIPAIKDRVQSVFYRVQPGGVRVLDGSDRWSPPVHVVDKTGPPAGPNEQRMNKRTAYETSFAAFYALYPKKTERKDALAVWFRLKPDADLVRRICESVTRHAKTHDWTKEGGKWVPSPRKFLHGARWDDEIAEPVGVIREIPDATAWRRDCQHTPACRSPFDHEAKTEAQRASA